MIALGVMAATNALTRISFTVSTKDFYACQCSKSCFWRAVACAFVQARPSSSQTPHSRRDHCHHRSPGRPPLTTSPGCRTSTTFLLKLSALAGFRSVESGNPPCNRHRGELRFGASVRDSIGRTHAWIAFANWAMHVATRIEVVGIAAYTGRSGYGGNSQRL